MAGLSNGITAQNTAVPWATGAVTVGLGILGIIGVAKRALASAANAPAAGGGTTATTAGGAPAAHPTAAIPTGHSAPPLGKLDPAVLFLHFQSISLTGLLDVRYPVVYQSFTANFAWASFIIPFPSFRKTASHLRKCNANSGNTNSIPAVSPSLSSGISTYSSQLGIDEQDIFTIIFLVFLSVCALIFGLRLLGEAVVRIATFFASAERKAVWEARRERMGHMFSNGTLRLVCYYRSLVLHAYSLELLALVGASPWDPWDLRLLSVDPNLHLRSHLLPLGYYSSHYPGDAGPCIIVHSTHLHETAWHAETVLEGSCIPTSLGVNV